MNRVARLLFEDRKNGCIVVAQMPNASMWIALAALALSFVVPAGRAMTAARVLLFLALIYWAVDEAARGVNPWRRMVGLGTLAGIFVWLVVLQR